MNQTNFKDYYQELEKIIETSQSDDEESESCCEQLKNYREQNGVIVCNICSQTITNIMDGPEWRHYSNEGNGGGDPSRCGIPTNALLPKSSLGSSVSNRNKSATMVKIGRYQQWNSMPYGERSMYKVFVDIETRCSKAGFPKVISQTAKSLYRILSETKVSRGSNRLGVIAACVYNSCKECEVPRSPNEIAKVFDISTKIMTKGCKQYTEIMRMSKTDMSRINNLKSIDLDDFIERFSYNLKISEAEIQLIMRLSSVSQDLGLIGDNTPSAMASGCIYLYVKHFNLDISKTTISEVCQISEVTINKCCKKLEASKDLMIYLDSHKEKVKDINS